LERFFEVGIGHDVEDAEIQAAMGTGGRRAIDELTNVFGLFSQI
jgi:hypothetical protein